MYPISNGGSWRIRTTSTSFGEIEDLKFASREMTARDPLHGDRPCPRPHPAVLVTEVLRKIVELAMAALLGLQHQRERGIAGDADLFQRVHLHGDGKRHIKFRSG
jgi:hypothetical protein